MAPLNEPTPFKAEHGPWLNGHEREYIPTLPSMEHLAPNEADIRLIGAYPNDLLKQYYDRKREQLRGHAAAAAHEYTRGEQPAQVAEEHAAFIDAAYLAVDDEEHRVRRETLMGSRHLGFSVTNPRNGAELTDEARALRDAKDRGEITLHDVPKGEEWAIHGASDAYLIPEGRIEHRLADGTFGAFHGMLIAAPYNSYRLDGYAQRFDSPHMIIDPEWIEVTPAEEETSTL